MDEPNPELMRCQRVLLELAKAIASGTVTGIHAIKAYRTAMDSSLIDSKHWYDAIRAASAPDNLDKIRNLDARVSRLESQISLNGNE